MHTVCVLSLLLLIYINKSSQVGSLAGAAHLLQDNAGVLRAAQWEQKSRVEHKGKSCFDFERFSVGIQTMKVWPSDP